MASPARPAAQPPSAPVVQGIAPPHSIEAEQSVLGAILLSEKTHYAYVIEENLQPEDFYRDRHRVIYAAMRELYNASEPIDVLTVTEHLRDRGLLEDAGGQSEIDGLAGAAPAVPHIRRYGQIVKNSALLRRLLTATYEIQASVHTRDDLPRDIVERAERAILEVAHDDRQKDFRRVGDVLHEEIDKWHALSTEGRALTGTTSGFGDLDEITGGFQPGNLIVIAARPSMGKCMRKGSLIYDPLTGARRRIEDVVDDIENGGEPWVAAVGPDLRLHAVRPTAGYRNGPRPLHRVTTRLGRTIDATANHPLLTLEGWRRLDELQPGDRIAVPRRLPRASVGQTATDRLRQIGYSTISERLARDVQHLLLRLGIVSRIRTLKRDVYEGTDKVAREVLITGQEGVARFVDTVAVCGKTAQRVRTLEGLSAAMRATNVDTVPVEVWDRVLTAKGARAWADVSAAAGHPRNHNWHVGTRGLSRDRLGVLAEAIGDEDLVALATSDLWWDEVASIEDAGVDETYDLTVPELHNFVADDVVVHNSALVTNIAENVALHTDRPRAVALFSLEMSEAELAQRFIASQASIKGDDLRKGRLKDERKWRRVLETASRYDAAPLYVDDSSDIGVLEVRAKARRLHQQAPDGLGLIIIDYLQLMRPDGRIESRVQQVGEMSRGLKILARELSVPVIALSQLSRGVESRTDKRPLLSDLRECVTGDTLVVLADGYRAPIRELVGTEPTVVAVNERDQLVAARSEIVWRVGRRPVLDIGLASGRSVRATTEHRLRTVSGWQPVLDLRAGIDDLLSATDGLAADRIIAIEPAGEEEVYDLTVPGPACWLADGIVSHNSGQIEQDADLVMFIYRDEYYNENSERPGEADLIIAKHRNGGLGDVSLTFQSEYPRFLGMQRVER